MLMYIIGSIIVVGVCLSLYFEKYWLPSLVPIACIAAAQYWHFVDVLSFIKNNTLEFVLYFVGFIGLGIVWSYVKWISVLYDFKTFRQELIDQYNQNPNNFTTSKYSSRLGKYEQIKQSLKEFLNDKCFYFDNKAFKASERPSASRCKQNIIGWICFWPFSFLVTLLTDPVRKIVTFIFNRLSKSYQKLAEYIVPDIMFEFETKVENKEETETEGMDIS